ncbi:hypothetical protein AMECASPLE_035603 [Ameca splendens]|uniref:Uncharacterized protein n=1 Tax=Ameca splendens TaxID=208324 RepID=A0ABV0XKG6_9TELE
MLRFPFILLELATSKRWRSLLQRVAKQRPVEQASTSSSTPVIFKILPTSFISSMDYLQHHHSQQLQEFGSNFATSALLFPARPRSAPLTAFTLATTGLAGF